MTLHDVQNASSSLVHLRVKPLPILPIGETAISAHGCSRVVGFCEDGS